jgi:methionine aminotransferase
MNIESKLPNLGTTIFSTISALALQHNAINLGQGFPDFAMDPALIDLVNEAMKNGHNQYAPMPGNVMLREALQKKIALTQGCNIDTQNEITITAGATQALFTAIMAIVHPGDEVLIFEPAYDCYAPAIALCGGVCKYITLHAPEFAIDWDLVSQSINSKTKLIIINTPNNPTGKVLSEQDMKKIEQIVLDNNLYLLSDEVYEHLVFDGLKHTSALTLSKIFDRTLAVFSFGKTFHCTGWKIGYVAGSAAWMHEFKKIHQYQVFCVNAPMQVALAQYLADSANYNSRFLSKKTRFVR